jgi:hypothetical protein
MLIQRIIVDKIGNNSKDYTYLGKHVKQVDVPDALKVSR